MSYKHFVLLTVLLLTVNAYAQMPSTGSETITGKFGTYYDQRELLFEAMPTSENDIIFLGNSITDGGEWCELFENPNCKNRGISGDIVPGVLNRLETITKGQPAMVFLMIGTNDMNWGFSNDSIALSIREVVQRIKQESPRTRIVVQSILPTNDCYGMFSGHTKRWQDVEVINGMLKTMTEEEGVEYLDLYSRFANEEGKMDPTYSNDGLHINGDGYLLWKEMVEDEIGRLPQPVRKSKVPIWLNMSAGLNVADCYDNGTIPFRYDGFGANAKGGLTIEWGRCHISHETQLFYNMLSDVNGSSTNVNLTTEFLYRFHDSAKNRWHYWVGGQWQTFVDIRDIPMLMNAASSVSVFGNLCATGMLQYDFAFNPDKTHPWLTAYGKLALPLVGLVNRPGYAYIGNPTINNNVLLDDNETFAKFFPGTSTELGLYLNLRNNNRVGLSYHWDYLTTGKKGAYRYDNALHSLTLNFMFNIN